MKPTKIIILLLIVISYVCFAAAILVSEKPLDLQLGSLAILSIIYMGFLVLGSEYFGD
jgi:hypothetical protein